MHSQLHGFGMGIRSAGKNKRYCDSYTLPQQRVSDPVQDVESCTRHAGQSVRLRYGITPINQGAVPPFPELLPLEDALVPSAQALSDRADDGDQLDKYLLYRA